MGVNFKRAQRIPKYFDESNSDFEIVGAWKPHSDPSDKKITTGFY